MTYHAVDCPGCEYRYGLGISGGGPLRVVDVPFQLGKVPAEIISPSTKPTATANIVGMINSTAISFRVIAQTRFDLPLWSSTTFA
jgi:hypothetical protein